MAFIPITNLGQATSMVMDVVHEDDSDHLKSQNVQFYLNESERILLGKTYFPFLDSEPLNFQQAKDSKLDGVVTAGDTSIVVVDSSGMFSDGRVLIDQSFIDYTANDLTSTLSGVTGVNVDLKSGSEVRQMYSLADDLGISQFAKPISCEVDGFDLTYYEPKIGARANGYTIMNGFLILPYSSQEKTVTLRYTKSVGNMTADTDEFTTPQPFIGVHIEYALWKAKQIISDSSWQENYRSYIKLKHEFFSYYKNQTERKSKFIRSVYNRYR